jgi:protease IV
MKKKRNVLIITGLILGSLWIISMIVASVFGFLLNFDSSDNYDNSNGNVAIIPLHGPIYVGTQSSFGSDGVTSDSFIELLNKADKSSSVKAIIIDINSGGGSGVAAFEISQKIQSIEKPVISVIRDSGASAAYWIATTTDYIFANPISITGSIGVIGSYLDFSEFIEEHNITYQRYVSGKYKDMGSAFKKPTNEEQKLLQNLINKMRDYFIEVVSKNRGLPVNDVKKLAEGQVFLGIDAKELELIDELGTKADALHYIENKYNITASEIVYKESRSIMDLLTMSTQIKTFINSDHSIEFK